ncbi:hypothetical protein HPB48_007844 [Haemaphysalis longicornis]|uniref:Endonuclease/exonuclease/phosphatase domain-containing protein n=1 Tax=Haemaphysalis longicornis TaxID=44386 RepID=A0A9J6FUF8_HAELO|nr:hypothetical protein HPB48_007844 [Haemaphysalis longicornis]
MLNVQSINAHHLDVAGDNLRLHKSPPAHFARNLDFAPCRITGLQDTRTALIYDDDSIDASVDSHSIGDICAVCTRTEYTPLLVVGVYVPLGRTQEGIKGLLQKKHAHHKLGDMPMIITGDFNVNLRDGQNQWLPAFMRDLFGISMASESKVPTTRFGSTLDHVFQRGLNNVEVKYASYFSQTNALLHCQ